MEPAQLQLVFNVIAITGVSSLASFWYLHKRDQLKLASQGNKTEVPPSLEIEKSGIFPEQCERPAAVAAPIEDIRNFAAHRRTVWVKGITSAMPLDPACPSSRKFPE